MRSNSVNFVDEIFNTLDSILAKRLFNNIVIGDGDSSLVNLSVSSLVDEFSDGFEVGVSENE